MLSKIVFFSWSILIICSCTNKKCQEAEDTARTKSKDANLMYIWRYTDDLIKNNNGKDSGFVSFKPNSNYNSVPTSKEIDMWSYVWYSENNIIRKSYCLDNVPQDDPVAKYLIKNDTLILYPSTGGGKSFATIPETYIHYKKY